MQEQRPQDGLAVVERAIAAFPQHDLAGQMQETRGRLLLMLQHHDVALDAFRAAVSINPSREAAQLGLAESLVRQNRKLEAIDALQSAVRLLPGSAAIHVRLAQLYLDLGQTENCVEPFRVAARLRPKQPVFHASLGAALFALNRLPDAEQAYLAAIACAPVEPAYHAEVGSILVRQGRLSDAIDAFKAGLAAKHDDPRLVARLAQALRASGDPAQAETILLDRLSSGSTSIVLNPELIDQVLVDQNLLKKIWPDDQDQAGGAGNPYQLVSAMKRALADALFGISDLDPAVLGLRGMSGKRYRYFINNLVRITPDARYLEVGSWAGSTLCSAINRNQVRAVAIDNWSLFGGPAAEFHANLARFKTEADATFIEADFRQVDFSSIGKFNLYLFDGPHGHQDQSDGVTLAQPAMDDYFILIVDDWNWPDVRTGTYEGIKLAGLSVQFSVEIFTSMDNLHAKVHGKDSDWHNGYFFSVLERLKAPGT
jgi:tetratricopeptide (TPR) repeat protein